MWSLRKPRASRVSLRRHLMLLTTTLVVAIFATISLPSPASAADAQWNGTTLTYENNVYTKVTSPPDRQGESIEYQWVDTSASPPEVTVIYFATGVLPGIGIDTGTGNEFRDTTATLITYDLNGTNYDNPSQPQTITVTRDLTAPATGENQTLGSTCDGNVTGGVGWILCPISNWLADGVDAVYTIVESFLEVVPISTTEGGIYQLWDVVRSIANVCFVIAFLIIIYSQLTSIGYSNYNIKDMVPRLIIAAILVNLSFWISALAVDISNLLGHSVQSILVNIRENYTTGANVSWASATGYILSGGTIALLGFAAAAGGSFPALGFLIIAALISAAMAILVAFIILAARQALITVLVIISPLAFVAYILPNTNSLFEKWRKSFTTLLVFFPIFALLFGGAQLAGAAIINNADGHMHIVLIGMATQVVPLIMTPLIIRFSTGLLGQIANMANNKSRGLVDRARNWAHDNADVQKAKKIASSDRMPGRNPLSWLSPSRLGRRMDYNKRRREAYKKDYEDYASHRTERDRMRSINEAAAPPVSGRDPRSRRERAAYRHREQMIRSHGMHEEAGIHKGRIDADGEEHWNNYLQSVAGASLRTHRRQTHLAKGRADIADKDMTAADDLELKRQVHASPHLRQAAERTIVNTSEAGAYQDAMAASADQTWKMRQHSNAALRTMRTDTARAKGVAEVYENSMASADNSIVKQQIHANNALRTLSVNAGVDNKQAALYQESIDASVDETWANRQQNNAQIRQLRTDTTHTKGRAKIIDESLSAADQRTFETLVNNDPGYLQIRRAKQQTITDTKHAQLQSAQVDAEGERRFQEDVLASPTLTKQIIDTQESKKRAEQAQTLINQQADAHWEDLTLNDDQLYTRNLQQQQYAKTIKASQQEWESILSEAGAGRTDDFVKKFGSPTADVQNAVDAIQTADTDIAAETFRKERSDYVMRKELNARLKADQTLLDRAAGIDQYGGDKVLASLQEEATNLYMTDVKAARSVFANDNRYTNNRLLDVIRNGTLADGTQASIIQRHAAIKRLAEETGNNYAAQDLVDFANEIGMLDDTDASGNPVMTDIYGNVLTDEEADTRRDTQQIILDSLRKGPNKVDWFSGTDQGMAETGRFVTSRDATQLQRFAGSELAITREINSGKIDFNKAFAADIDVINKQALLLSNPDVINELIEPEAARQYANTLEKFLKDEDTGMKLEKRKRGSYHVLLKELQNIASGTAFDLASIDTNYTDVETGETFDILDGNRASRKPGSARPTGPIVLT